MAIFRGLILVEVRILPAAPEMRDACVSLPSHLHFLVWIQSKLPKKRRWAAASWDKRLTEQLRKVSRHEDRWETVGRVDALPVRLILALFNAHAVVINNSHEGQLGRNASTCWFISWQHKQNSLETVKNKERKDKKKNKPVYLQFLVWETSMD